MTDEIKSMSLGIDMGVYAIATIILDSENFSVESWRKLREASAATIEEHTGRPAEDQVAYVADLFIDTMRKIEESL